MTKKWIAITLLLLVFTGLLGRQLYISVLRFYANNDISKIQPVRDMKSKNAQESPQAQQAPAKKLSPSEFAVVPETNVFSESRAKEDKAEIAAPPEPPPLAQKPILVGVTIVDTMRKASIIDPTNPSQDKNRRAQIKRIGDSFHGYIITEITPTSMVLESGTRKEIIPLHEGSKRTQGGKTPILSTRVVSFGGASSGGAPVTVSGGAGRSTAASVGSPTSATPSAGSPAATMQQRTSSTPAQPATGQPAQQNPNTGTDSQGRRIIRTPFGDIVRPNRD